VIRGEWSLFDPQETVAFPRTGQSNLEEQTVGDGRTIGPGPTQSGIRIQRRRDRFAWVCAEGERSDANPA